MKLFKVKPKQKETTIIPHFFYCVHHIWMPRPSLWDAIMVLKFNHANYGLTEVLGLGAAASAAAAGELLPSD